MHPGYDRRWGGNFKLNPGVSRAALWKGGHDGDETLGISVGSHRYRRVWAAIEHAVQTRKQRGQ